MAKSDYLKFTGVVQSAQRNSMFEVLLDNGHTVVCTISGKLRINYIRILPGDSVEVEMSPYDLSKGRIIWRNK